MWQPGDGEGSGAMPPRRTARPRTRIDPPPAGGGTGPQCCGPAAAPGCRPLWSPRGPPRTSPRRRRRHRPASARGRCRGRARCPRRRSWVGGQRAVGPRCTAAVRGPGPAGWSGPPNQLQAGPRGCRTGGCAGPHCTARSLAPEKEGNGIPHRTPIGHCGIKRGGLGIAVGSPPGHVGSKFPFPQHQTPPVRRRVPAKRRRLPAKRRRLPAKRRRLPTNRRRLPSTFFDLKKIVH